MVSGGALEFLSWRDVFVIIDNGRAGPEEYERLEHLVVQQLSKHPGGLGALTVIPPDAVPPSPEARSAIRALLGRVDEGVRCACWLVEGGGFQGAMVRAVLIGLSVFGRYRYPTHVATELDEALQWMLLHLRDAKGGAHEASAGLAFLRAERARTRSARGDRP
jgi:hypothetical protein